MTPAQVTPNRQNYVAIGKIKENLVTEVVFPCPDLGEGTGSYTVVFQRPRESAPYPVMSRTEWPNIIWEVGAADTAKPGTGKAEVRWYGDGDKVGKSKTYVVTVTDGLADPTEAPEAYAGYVAQVARNAEAAKSAASGAETSAGKAEAVLKALEDGIASGDFRGEKGEKGDTGPEGPQGEAGPAGKDAPQIDDTAISRANPWSSRQIIDTLCPALEETGNPVTCYPVAGYPLGVNVGWEPTQAGSGEPSPDNIRPIKGRNGVTITRQEDNYVIALTLPETVYGGKVDAVTGDGESEWAYLTIDGSEVIDNYRKEDNTDTYKGFSINLKLANVAEQRISICSHFHNGRSTVSGYFPNTMVVHPQGQIYIRTEIPGVIDVDTFKAYLAAQYAAGTPVQIAYKLAQPVPFTATGVQPIPALAGCNTVLTDADSVTVTGREDPAHAIAALQAQIEETQAAMVDTTAMAVDYIYEQDSQIIGGDDDDNQANAMPT